MDVACPVLSLTGRLLRVHSHSGSRRLVLVKHSAVTVDPTMPASAWRLSAEGRLRAKRLAESLARYTPRFLIASQGPKAAETGQIVARLLGLPLETAPDLHEHDRLGAPFYGPDEWQVVMRRFFAQPDTLVFGRETATQAATRFTQAVDRVLAQHPDGSLAVVAHGTVISLFVAQRAGLDPFALWRRLDLPSFVVVARPEYAVVEVVERV